MMPVFIGGCPRSGTTLLGAMLGAHSRCVATPESIFTIRPLAARFRQNGNRLSESIIDEVLKTWRFRTWDLPVSKQDLAGLFDSSSLAALLEYLVEEYARKRGKLSFDFWIDHTPQNTSYALTLLEHFPDAKFIHLVRDARAVAASVMRVPWGPNTAEFAARSWLSWVFFGLSAETALSGEQILRVKYENLISAPQETLERICAFCGFDFETEMVKGGGLQVPTYSQWQHRLVGSPPRPERIHAWKNELSRHQVETIEHWTADALLYLGYELEYGLLARPPWMVERGVMIIREYVQRVVNRCLRAVKWKQL